MNKQNITTFYLVRHGETDWNKKRIIQGQTDTELNTTGKDQAEETAKLLNDISFDLAFSSDLLRAKRTTETIALEHNLAVQTTKALRERHFGNLQGQPFEAMQAYDKLLQKLTDEERARSKHNEHFESDDEMLTRIITFFRETAITHPGKTVLVGTHGGVLRLFLHHLGYFTYKRNSLPQIANTTISNMAYIKFTSDGIDFFLKETSGININSEQAKRNDE